MKLTLALALVALFAVLFAGCSSNTAGSTKLTTGSKPAVVTTTPTALPQGRAGANPSQDGLTLKLFNLTPDGLVADANNPLKQTSRTEYECNADTAFVPTISLVSRGSIPNNQIFFCVTKADDSPIDGDALKDTFDKAWAEPTGTYKVYAVIKVDGAPVELSVWLNVVNDPTKAVLTMKPFFRQNPSDPTVGFIYLPVTCASDSPMAASDVKVYADVSPDGVVTVHAEATNGKSRDYQLNVGKSVLFYDGTVRVNEDGATFRNVGSSISDPASLESGIRVGNLALGQTREANFYVHTESLAGMIGLTDQSTGASYLSGSIVPVGTVVTATVTGYTGAIWTGVVKPNGGGYGMSDKIGALLNAPGKYVFYFRDANSIVGKAAVLYAR